MDTSTSSRRPAGATVDHVETEPLDDGQHDNAVNALAALINEWNESRRSS